MICFCFCERKNTLLTFRTRKPSTIKSMSDWKRLADTIILVSKIAFSRIMNSMKTVKPNISTFVWLVSWKSIGAFSLTLCLRWIKMMSPLLWSLLLHGYTFVPIIYWCFRQSWIFSKHSQLYLYKLYYILNWLYFKDDTNMVVSFIFQDSSRRLENSCHKHRNRSRITQVRLLILQP